MASRKLKQSPGYEEQLSAPARLINERMKKLGMKQIDLAAESGLTAVKINRIFRNARKAGDTYRFTETDINRISIALRWGKSGRDKLRYTVWPELACYDEALENHEGLVGLNIRLHDKGLPMVKTKE